MKRLSKRMQNFIIYGICALYVTATFVGAYFCDPVFNKGIRDIAGFIGVL